MKQRSGPRRHHPALATMAAVGLVAGWLTALAAPAIANDAGNSVYTRTSSSEILAYDRTIRLQHSGAANGTLLSTFEHGNTTSTPTDFVIRKSTDDGATWTTAATISDPLTGPDHPSNQMWQPFLFELPTTMGTYPAGTLLLVGNIAPSTDVQTNFVLWRSTDHGSTWTYQSVLQTGGGASGAPNGGSGIWEPFLTVNGAGQLAMYFSDERQEPTYAQIIDHMVSNDGGVTWSANPDGSTNFSPGLVVDVASSSSTDRPGMPTIATLPNGNMVMAYEICGTGRNCEAHIKTSTDGGTTWGSGPSDLGTMAVTSDGRYLGSSPYIVWSPAGGPNGQLMLTGMRTRLVSDNSFTQEDRQAIFINTSNGSGNWSWAPAPFQPIFVSGINCSSSYSPDLLLGASGTSVRYTTATAIGSTGCMEATDEANSGVLPYASSFDGGQAGWINYGGCWSTSGGVFSETCGGSGGNKSIAGSTGWSDYTLQGDVRIDSGPQAGFVVRASNPFVGADALNGYFVGVSSTQLFLGKENGGWTALTNVAIPGGLSLGSWYHVTVQAVGCTLTVTGAPSGSTATPIGFSYTDSGCFTQGAIGVRDQTGTASWRNIVVSQGGLTSTTPAPYQAPFDSGSASGWTTYGGTWTVGGNPGVYSDTAGGPGDKSVTGSTAWTNYTMSGEVSLGNPSGNAGLLVRVTNPSVGTDSLNGYFIGVTQNSLFIGREANSWTMLTSSALPVPLAANAWYRMIVQVSGCAISVSGLPSTGGESVFLSYTDTGCTTTSAGQVGVRTYNTTASWRYVQVVQGPASDFSVSVSPNSGSVTAGGSTSATVSTAVTSGSAETVSLSASGVPSGVSVSFSPSSVTAGSSSTMSISTASSTTPGTYTITVTGSASSGSHSASYTLTVGSAGGGGGSLSNPGFETGSLSSWSCQPGDGVVTSPVHSGSYAAAIVPTSSQTGECDQTITLSPNTSYTLTGWVQGNYAYIGVSGDASASTWVSSSSWTQLSVPFTTGSTGQVTVYVHGWYSQGNVYADDFAVG